jgi:hypothetical protein
MGPSVLEESPVSILEIMRSFVVWWTDTNIWEQPVASMSYSEGECSRFIRDVVTCLPNYMPSHSCALLIKHHTIKT